MVKLEGYVYAGAMSETLADLNTPLTSPPPAPMPGRRLAKIGGLMQIAPLIGLAGTVVGMIRAFETLGTAGTADSTALSKAIGEVLVWTAMGVSVALVGWVLLLTAMFAYSYRARWIFWLIVVQGMVTILSFKAVALIGVGMIALAIFYREQFLGEKADQVG